MNAAKELTDREMQILNLISKGFTNNKIAMALNISEYTVETHRKNINNKLGTNSTATLLMVAREKGLI